MPEPTLVNSEDLAAETAARILGDAKLPNPYSRAPLPRTAGRLAANSILGAEPPFVVRQLVIGDSYSVTAAIDEYYTPVRERGFEPNPTLGGGATSLSNEWTRTPAAGRVHRLNGSGQTVAFTQNMLAHNVRVFYNTEPGAGTFALEVSENGGSSWTEVPGATTASPLNAATGSGIGAAVFSYNYTDTKTRMVRAKWVSGTTYILGFVLSDIQNPGKGTRGGSAVFDFSIGGIVVANNAQCPAAIWTVILNNLTPDFVTVKSDDDYSTNSLEPLYDLVNGVRAMDWIFFGQHARNAFPTTAPNASDILLRALADSKKQAYFETRAIFGDFDEMKAVGFGSEGNVHLTATGQRYQEINAAYHLKDSLGVVAEWSRNREGVEAAPIFGALRAKTNGSGSIIEIKDATAGNPVNPGTSFRLHNFGSGRIGHIYGSNDYIRQIFDSINTVFLGGTFGGGNHVSPSFTRSAQGNLEVFTGNHTTGTALAISTAPSHTGNGLTFFKDSAFASGGTDVANFSPIGKFRAKGGAAASLTGTFTLVAGVATINTTAVATNDHINLQLSTPGGTMGARYKVEITNGVSFTITAVDLTGATVTTDTSRGTWHIAAGRF